MHSVHIQEQIYQLALEELKSLLRQAAIVRAQTYILQDRHVNYREWEESTSHEAWEKLSGIGVIASRTEMHESIVQDHVPLVNAELSADLMSFPLRAAAASLMFTKLEIFGNKVADIIGNPVPDEKSWHVGVWGKADIMNVAQVKKARKGFGQYFGLDESQIPEIAAILMILLKKQRNEFAHAGASSFDFDEYLKNILTVVCHIVYVNTDARKYDRISVYPFEDHEDRFTPKSV